MPYRERLVISGDVLGRYNSEGRGAYRCCRNLAYRDQGFRKHTTVHRRNPPTPTPNPCQAKNDLAQKINSAKIVKPCSSPV